MCNDARGLNAENEAQHEQSRVLRMLSAPTLCMSGNELFNCISLLRHCVLNVMEAQGSRKICLTFLEALLRNELAQEMPVVERLRSAGTPTAPTSCRCCHGGTRQAGGWALPPTPVS